MFIIKSRMALGKYFLLIIAFLSSNIAASSGDEYQEFFEKCNVDGFVALSDLSGKKQFITNETHYNKATLPASTFKIVNTLISLDTGVVGKGELFLWDGVERSYPVWNGNLTLEEAFKHSAVWVYEVINARLNNAIYERYLDWLDYGNGNITNGKPNNFWVYGDFEVLPEQQMSLLKRLYSDTLPFSKSSMHHLKQLMRVYDAELGQVYSKTGAVRKEGEFIGWWIGYIVRNQESLFFVTRITRKEDLDFKRFLDCRKSITRQVIKNYDN